MDLLPLDGEVTQECGATVYRAGVLQTETAVGITRDGCRYIDCRAQVLLLRWQIVLTVGVRGGPQGIAYHLYSNVARGAEAGTAHRRA